MNHFLFALSLDVVKLSHGYDHMLVKIKYSLGIHLAHTNVLYILFPSSQTFLLSFKVVLSYSSLDFLKVSLKVFLWTLAAFSLIFSPNLVPGFFQRHFFVRSLSHLTLTWDEPVSHMKRNEQKENIFRFISLFPEACCKDTRVARISLFASVKDAKENTDNIWVSRSHSEGKRLRYMPNHTRTGLRISGNGSVEVRNPPEAEPQQYWSCVGSFGMPFKKPGELFPKTT